MAYKAHKGKFFPKNRKKYKGNPANITYRSSWEQTFMNYCDRKSSIVEWASEEIVIPYFCPTDRKRHRYFPDFYVKMKNAKGHTKVYIIEVKPEKETKPPKKKGRHRQYLSEAKTYAKNQAKWKAAEEFCSKRNWEFKVLTEKVLLP